MTPDLREKVYEAAKKYSEEQFEIAEERTVAPHCNDETFFLAFFSGAEFMHTLMAERIESLEAALKQISQANYDDIEGVFTLAREALENK